MTDKFIEAFLKLDDTEKEIVKIKLSYPTCTQADIGRLLKVPVTRQAVGQKIQNNPEIQACIDLIEMDVIRGLKSLYPQALVGLRRSLNSKNEAIAQRAQEFILKKCVDSDHMLPDRIDDSELTFVYEDIGVTDGEEKSEDQKSENDQNGKEV